MTAKLEAIRKCFNVSQELHDFVYSHGRKGERVNEILWRLLNEQKT